MIIFFIKQTLTAAIASVVSGIIFQCNRQHLIGCAIAGGIGSLVYELIYVYTGTIYLPNFIAAICFQILAEIFAVRFKTTVTTYSICALIPLVPGAGMYYTMKDIIDGAYFAALNKGIETLGIAGALALGIIFVSTFSKAYRMYRKKV